MRYLSLFSGIEAASVAWGPLGWKCAAVAEIEPFPCAVLREHYPKVPNLGDVTKITREMVRGLGKLDIVIFGSPCQDLSVAGKRAGLEGARSGLFFTAIEIIQWAHEECGARFALWENVPGAFSSNAGGDFAEVVGALAGCRIDIPEHGWGTEGAAVGPNGLVEWSVLDAQWFGVAQRRRRVFALLDTGVWSRRPPILLEPQSLRGDSAPSREAGQSPAGTLANRAGVGSHWGGGAHPSLNQSNNIGGIGMSNQEMFSQRGAGLVPSCFGGNNTAGPIDVATARNACASASGRMDFESETFVTFDSTQVTSKANRSNPKPGDPCHPLAAGGHPPAIAFHHNTQAAQLPTTTDTSKTAALTCSQGAAVCCTGEVFHTLRSEGFDASEDGTGRGGGAVVVGTLAIRGRQGESVLEARYDGTSNAILTPSGGRAGIGVGAIHVSEVAQPVRTNYRNNSDGGMEARQHIFEGTQVRRLTPTECERLQGFPDGYTKIPWRGKPVESCPDGPRYKALGNSMAVPVIRWIGQAIERTTRRSKK